MVKERAMKRVSIKKGIRDILTYKDDYICHYDKTIQKSGPKDRYSERDHKKKIGLLYFYLVYGKRLSGGIVSLRGLC